MEFGLIFEALIPGTTQDHLQIFNIEMKTKVKAHQMPEQVLFCTSLLLVYLGLVFGFVWKWL